MPCIYITPFLSLLTTQSILNHRFCIHPIIHTSVKVTISQGTNCSSGVLTHSHTDDAASGAIWDSVSCSKTHGHVVFRVGDQNRNLKITGRPLYYLSHSRPNKNSMVLIKKWTLKKPKKEKQSFRDFFFFFLNPFCGLYSPVFNFLKKNPKGENLLSEALQGQPSFYVAVW